MGEWGHNTFCFVLFYDQTIDILQLTIFLFEVLVCWVSSIEKINKQNNETVLWSSPRNPKLMFVNICLFV